MTATLARMRTRRSRTISIRSRRSLERWTYLPTLVGVVLAASVAVEMEQGTYRLAWAQSVTRGRWMLNRIGLPLLFGVAITGLIAAMTSWWMQPANQIQGALRPGAFDVQGLLPPAYMVLAFAITIAAGVVARRIVPAVGLGIVAGIGAHLAVQGWLRANFVAPMSSIWMSGPSPYGPRDWVVQGEPGPAATCTSIQPGGSSRTNRSRPSAAR